MGPLSVKRERPMALPVVAIVGRPNVGKSSLLNCLTGKRISIVAPTPGVTRDRVSAPVPVADGYVELVDTGGFGIEDADQLTDHVETQIRYAVAAADMILFVVDALDGALPLDARVADLLRRQDRPVRLVANKCDTDIQETQTAEFIALGFGEPMPVSAMHGRGRAALLAAIADTLGHRAESMAETVMKLAIVGKRNSGKSTLINTLAGEQRVIVSETPGTTRDSVDVRFSLGKREFIAIDTAGVRKKSKMRDDVEYYGFHRAQRSIRRADVVALLIDAVEPMGTVDKQLASYIVEQFRPVVLVVNKWDLAAGRAERAAYEEYIGKVLPHLSYAPISFTVATNGTNVMATVRLALQLFAQADTRVPTARLNATVAEIVTLRGPSHKRGTKPPKLLYATQVATHPPTIVCFVNSLACFTVPYQRFFVNQLRDRLPFPEVPIRLLFRSTRRTGPKPAPAPDKPVTTTE